VNKKAAREETSVRTTLSFHPRPRRSKGWIAAGYVPADRIYVEFPRELMPEVAKVRVGRAIGDHAVCFELYATGLTEDEMTGVMLAQGRNGIVTFDDAREALAKHRERRASNAKAG
jgi:hypothetical protein